MRAAFHGQLNSLTEMLSKMCGLAGLAMDRATQALLHSDLAIAERVITDHDELAHLQTRAEQAALVFARVASTCRGRPAARRWFLTERVRR